MNRESGLERLRTKEAWDVLVIGGGATGLGCAVEAAARGYHTLLVEQHDFAKGTSSRSTKLVHGGVRYLKQGNLSLVLEALHERGLLCQNAPHLVRHLAFVVPVYSWWEGPFYGIGMKLYDRLAGELGLKPSKRLSKAETLQQIPTVEESGLLGGVCYYDAQFDDARLAINLAQTVFDLGGVALNYVRATRLTKRDGLVVGAAVTDAETGEVCDLRAQVVINATGVFCDEVRQMDEPGCEPVVTASQGAHLVLPREFLPGESAIMVPHTPDGRVLFAVPWHDRVVVGTTDVPVDRIDLEPKPMEQEIEFILANAARYLSKNPRRSDVLSAFAGLRPLVRVDRTKDTAALSREHTILISNTGLLTITGGKWTTYRKMAEETINEAETIAGFVHRESKTRELPIHGSGTGAVSDPRLAGYGGDTTAIQALAAMQPGWTNPIHPALPYRCGEIVWAAREEMARTVEDVLARRTRALLLDARASIQAAPTVSRLLREELGRSSTWPQESVAEYVTVAKRYLLD